ncbi:MAG TPA: serine/threonine-protein kinase [Solirubrobacterales bacterium]|nr:serine/threonine-protein kinase [Solirubrobacterales bacterium]
MARTIGPGELLKDRYRLERTLGRGGMAAVWLGHDEVLDRPVAVKVLSDTIAGDPGFVARFRREAHTAAGLSHPNLVDVYDFSEEGERPYLVMQCVPGENLAERLERGRDVDCEQLARELLAALAHIHAAGILHRDVKPANVILEPSGTAKLIDFGIALPRDATALTSTGLVLGTERYAAPEVMAGEPATERSDLYSCGLVLRACADGVAPDLRVLVEWLASRNPQERPRSAREALARLDRPAAPVERPTEVFEPTQAYEPTLASRPVPRESSSRGRWGAAAALVAFVVAVAAIAVVALSGGDEERPAPQRAQSEQGEGKSQPAKSQTSAEEPDEPDFEEAGSNVAVPVPEGTDPAAGASLNEEGFALIQAGEYEAAVPKLEEAVAAFPAGSEDLDYAYALFNLGNALRLSGRPEEAIPVLERRLEIPNQTAEVEEELAAARAEAE